ncbi:MAG: hypothetical protein N2505_00525 [Endomicrobia bacterium]|nr:hypothetical protein [Endomicrobiia bacterium]
MKNKQKLNKTELKKFLEMAKNIKKNYDMQIKEIPANVWNITKQKLEEEYKNSLNLNFTLLKSHKLFDIEQ